MRYPLSRRRRQVAITAGCFALFALAAVFLTRTLTRRSSPYRPGEGVEGLTAALARDLPANAPRVTFTDVTAAAGIEFRHFPARRTEQLPEDVGSGAAWGDYDNDGWLDLFLVNIAEALPGGSVEPGPGAVGSPGRSVLYRNLGDGTFRDVTDDVGIAHAAVGMAATWADYDNDGWTDLFVSAYGENTLYRNEGGTFRDVTEEAGMGRTRGFWTAAAWGDYDRDGNLDLYVTGYVRYTIGANAGVSHLQYEVEVPASLNPSAFRPHRNLLWHNQGDGTFREVAQAAGVLDEEGRGLGAAWADFDEDGWPDLYVANDVSDNALYHNRGDGTFENVSHASLVADYRGAMGLAIGDWDGDQDLDLFITHWIAQENALFSNRRSDFASADGPTRPLQFMDEANRVGLGQIALDYIGWGTSFFDYDNDGRLDLFVANGSTFQRPDAPELLVPMRDLLFWNGGRKEGFFDVSAVAGEYFAREFVGRGAAFADYDRDGDVDVLVLNHGGRPALLRNDGGTAGTWLGVLLEGRRSNRSAIGARVRVVTNGVAQLRSVGSQTSYLSHNSPVQHFGLGDAAAVDTLEVLWPSGERGVWTDVPAGRAVRIVEGGEAWEVLWAADRTAAGPQNRGLPGKNGSPSEGGPATTSGREDVLRFWELFREATRLRIAGELERAAAGYREALELNPTHADALYYLGSVRLALGEYEASETALRRLTELDPESARAHSQLGVLNACPDEGAPLDLSLASYAFDRAWAINREQTGTPLWLGLIALLREDLPTAHGHFEDVLGSNPRSIAANYLLGYAAWAAGDSEEATKAFTTALELAAPPTTEAEVGLGEGDTRGRRLLFASAMSCRWLEDRLAPLAGEPGRTSGDSPATSPDASQAVAMFRALDASFRRARDRIF